MMANRNQPNSNLKILSLKPLKQQDTIGAMLWREILRILRCGPSKRPAANPTYNKTNSHPSMSNLNGAASATSLNNKSGHYSIRMPAESSLNRRQSRSAANQNVYGQTPSVYAPGSV